MESWMSCFDRHPPALSLRDLAGLRSDATHAANASATITATYCETGQAVRMCDNGACQAFESSRIVCQLAFSPALSLRYLTGLSSDATDAAVITATSRSKPGGVCV